MDKKFTRSDFRRPRIDASTEAELKAFHQRMRDQVDLVRDKTTQMKESVIRVAVGPDTAIGPDLCRRMRWEFHPGGIEKVFLDGKLLVVFQPGYLDLDSGQWKVPYQLAGRLP